MSSDRRAGGQTDLLWLNIICLFADSVCLSGRLNSDGGFKRTHFSTWSVFMKSCKIQNKLALLLHVIVFHCEVNKIMFLLILNINYNYLGKLTIKEVRECVDLL